MRLLLEVVGTGVEIAKFPNRKTGVTDEVPVVWVSGVDVDFMDQLLKVKIFRPKNIEALKSLTQKGTRLAVKFRKIKPADRFETCTVITTNEEDVRLELQVGAQSAPVTQAFLQPAQSVQPGNGVQSQQPAMALAA